MSPLEKNNYALCRRDDNNFKLFGNIITIICAHNSINVVSETETVLEGSQNIPMTFKYMARTLIISYLFTAVPIETYRCVYIIKDIFRGHLIYIFLGNV